MIESIEYRHRIRLVHKYTPKTGPDSWGKTETRLNNECSVASDPQNPELPDQSQIDSYLELFGHRVDEEPHKYEYKGKYEGTYGYMWDDIRIEVVTERIEITRSTIKE